jgi:DNA-binding NtrC family response regulator/tetratricopeptide (TPR) repeat protein
LSSSTLADRFLPLAHALHLDLATGDRAWLRIAPATRGPEALRWNERCATLTTLWHPGMAECLDFGPLGHDTRFEAYRVNGLLPLRSARPFDGPNARGRVEEFLITCGVPPGIQSIEGADASGRPLVVPGTCPVEGEAPVSSGQSGATGESRGDRARARTRAGIRGGIRARTRAHMRIPAGSIGVRLVQRGVYAAVRERLEAQPSTGITVTDVNAPLGAGGRTLLRYCAREARRLGWVALATPAIRWLEDQRAADGAAVWDALVAGRHLLVLHDGRRSPVAADRELAAVVLRLGTRVARPHRVIQLVLRPRAADVLTVAPFTPAELSAMLVIAPDASRAARRITSAAASSGGLPGRYLDTVLALCAPQPRVADAVTRAYVVHDMRAPFGTAAVPSASADQAPLPPLAVPVRSGRAEVWRAIAESERLAGAGRHAAAERLLRAAAAAQVRRGREREAGDAALACGRLHIDRGRTAAALASFSEALSRYERAGAGAQMAIASTWLGRAHLDALQVDESESCLRAALAASGLGGHRSARAWAGISLARTLWWLGRYDEAHAILHGVDASAADADDHRAVPAPPLVALAHAMLAARISCALGEPDRAAVQITAARAHAAAIGTPASACLAELARAHWCAALGDATGLDGSAASGLRLARDARRPLDALRFRVLRCQTRALAGSHLQPVPDQRALRRALGRALPALLAAQVRLALAACAGAAAFEAVRAGHGAQGLAGLGASCPALAASSRDQLRSVMIDDLIEVLRICQEGEDARVALTEVARVVQARTRADAVVFAAAARRPLVVSWPSGGRAQLNAATRAIDTGLPIAPQVTSDGTEAAHPVRCGGVVIGAVACRWSGPPPVDPGRAAALLSAVAAAVAPAVRVLVDCADAPALPGIEAELLGVSRMMEDVRRAVARAADAPYPVLVQAESGAGKELVARAIHRAGARRTRPFCALNCAALPDDLMEAELFGHTRGAFTGAVAERRGLFEEADGGVLFLDEVGELSPRGQAKLLRVIQEGEIRRIGETVPRRVDVRLIAATNRLLEQEVEAGRFRRDLWYRLDVIRIIVPPLRERPEDVPVLAAGFWRRAAERVGSRAVLSDATIAALARYDWPGNVRELQNVLAALAVGAARRGVVGPSALPATLARVAAPADGVTLEQARRVFDTRFVRAALARAGGHRGRAAAELGVTRQGLAKLMERLGVDAGETRTSAAARRSLDAAVTP